MPDTDPSVEDLLDVAVEALGGIRRDGQHQMAVAVAETIEKGEHLLVQAGTGTGKSLGYLVPAVRHAVLENEHVVVSTATLALQRQIMTRDLPLVAKALEPHLPRPASIALLKGWHNYVCVHKVAGGYPEDDAAGALFDLGDHAGAVEHPAAEPGAREPRRAGRPAARVGRGDRRPATGTTSSRASPTARGGRSPSRRWSAWAASARCSPSASRRRRKAASREADVVVTNHAMLGIAASGSPNVLPEHQVLVVDEAHELTDRVTAQATSELSVAVIEHAARLARRHGGIPTTDLDSASQALAGVLVTLPEARFRDGLPPAARDAVAAVRDATRTLLSVLKPEGAGAAASRTPAARWPRRRCSRCTRWPTAWPPTPRTTGTRSCGARAPRTAAGTSRRGCTRRRSP